MESRPSWSLATPSEAVEGTTFAAGSCSQRVPVEYQLPQRIYADAPCSRRPWARVCYWCRVGSSMWNQRRPTKGCGGQLGARRSLARARCRTLPKRRPRSVAACSIVRKRKQQERDSDSKLRQGCAARACRWRRQRWSCDLAASNCAGRDGQLPDWTTRAAADEKQPEFVTQVRTGREIDDSLWFGSRWETLLAIGGLRIANRKSAGAWKCLGAAVRRTPSMMTITTSLQSSVLKES